MCCVCVDCRDIFIQLNFPFRLPTKRHLELTCTNRFPCRLGLAVRRWRRRLGDTTAVLFEDTQFVVLVPSECDGVCGLRSPQTETTHNRAYKSNDTSVILVLPRVYLFQFWHVAPSQTATINIPVWRALSQNGESVRGSRRQATNAFQTWVYILSARYNFKSAGLFKCKRN